jgi:hypothetical protein
METWKRAVVFGSLGAGTALFLAGRRPAGVALAGMGLGLLAYDKRRELTTVLKHAPEWVDRAAQIANVVADLGQRVMEGVQSQARRAEEVL